MGQNIDYEYINGKISELSALSSDINTCRLNVSRIWDGYCTGQTYTAYKSSASEISSIMSQTKIALDGYIAMLQYAVAHYDTIDSDMADYFKQ